MIKASELRIGNLIKLGKQAERVYQIIFDMRDGYSINHKDYKEYWYEPIQLTPEIIENAGGLSKVGLMRISSNYSDDVQYFWEVEGQIIG